MRLPVRGLRLALCLACGWSSAQAAIVSTFDTGSEGWTGQGDIAAPVTWIATGGNPDGHIRLVDATSGGVTYFAAPAAFLGNRGDAFGQMLSFDVRQTISGGANQFNAADVVLIGGGLTLVYDFAANPPIGAWTNYSVSFLGAGWKVGTLTGANATDLNMNQVLSSLTALRIRSEYQTGADTGYLDNVMVTTVPEPSPLTLLLAGMLVMGSLTLRRNRGE